MLRRFGRRFDRGASRLQDADLEDLRREIRLRKDSALLKEETSLGGADGMVEMDEESVCISTTWMSLMFALEMDQL